MAENPPEFQPRFVEGIFAYTPGSPGRVIPPAPSQPGGGGPSRRDGPLFPIRGFDRIGSSAS